MMKRGTQGIRVVSNLGPHAADLDAHTFQMLDLVETSKYIWFGCGGPARGTQVVTASRLVGTIIYIPRPLTINAMNIHVTGAGAASTVLRLLIYNVGTNYVGGSLLLNAGTVAADSTGVKA